jgi:hypothetical protein
MLGRREDRDARLYEVMRGPGLKARADFPLATIPSRFAAIRFVGLAAKRLGEGKQMEIGPGLQAWAPPDQFFTHTSPGPSEMVTQLEPVGQTPAFCPHRISHEHD